jgi:predicted small metal-binding protein
MTEGAKRWTCVEAGCSYELVAADVPSAIKGAQEHIADAHGSFELEEMIEDVLEDVPEAAADQTSQAARSPRTPH